MVLYLLFAVKLHIQRIWFTLLLYVNPFADKPKIVCESVVHVKINKPNFSLICKVYSNPEVRLAKIYWSHSHDNNETSEDGIENADYIANITMVIITIL